MIIGITESRRYRALPVTPNLIFFATEGDERKALIYREHAPPLIFRHAYRPSPRLESASAHSARFAASWPPPPFRIADLRLFIGFDKSLAAGHAHFPEITAREPLGPLNIAFSALLSRGIAASGLHG